MSLPASTEHLSSVEPAFAIPPAAESLAEDKLSLLQEFLESLPSLTGSAGSFITAFLAAHGIDLGMDDALNPATAAGQVSIGFGSCEAVADGEVRSTTDLADAVAFAPPSDYTGVMPKTPDEEQFFEELWTSSCDALAIQAEHELSAFQQILTVEGPQNRLEYYRNSYRMVRDILDYKQSHGLC